MPHWPTRQVSTRLIKYITSIRLSYNPYLPSPSNPRHVRGVREFETRMLAGRFKASNPGLRVEADVHNRVWEGEGGEIVIKYVNGEEIKMSKFQGNVGEIEEEMFRKATELEFEYEREGKTVE